MSRAAGLEGARLLDFDNFGTRNKNELKSGRKPSMAMMMSKIPAQLGKRATPASDTHFNETTLQNRPEKMQDYNTLKGLWSYY